MFVPRAEIFSDSDRRATASLARALISSVWSQKGIDANGRDVFKHGLTWGGGNVGGWGGASKARGLWFPSVIQNNQDIQNLRTR